MRVEAPPKAGRREWIGLAMLALPTLLVSMDLTVLHLAVPDLSEDLEPSSTQLLWIVDIYGFMIAGWLVTAGTLGDRIGRRRLLLAGAAAFGVASALAAYSNSAEMLIVTRGLLGVAGATLMPSTMALIRNMFHDEVERSRAIGVWMTSFMVGGTLGPLVGGALLDAFWWGAVFLMGVPVMLLLLILGPKLLPEYRNEEVTGRLDITSAVLSLVAVLSVVYGVKQVAEHGVGVLPLVLVLLGAVVGWVFVRRQRTASSPLLNLRLFGNPRFSVAMVALTVNTGVMMGLSFFAAQYLQLVLGLSPLQAGLWTLPMTIAGIPAALLTPGLVRYVRPAYLMATGLLIAAAGFLLITRVDGTGPGVLVTGTVVMFVGLSVMGVLGTDMAVGSAPPEEAGAASAVTETGNELGGALGLALLGSIGSAVYGAHMADGGLSGVPAAAADAARGSLGGAVAAVADLPQRVGDQLLAVSRDAFLQSLHLVALTCCAAVVLLAVAVAVLLRGVGRPTDAEPAGQTEENTGPKAGQTGRAQGLAAHQAGTDPDPDPAADTPAGR